MKESLKNMDGDEEAKEQEEPKFIAFTGKGVTLGDADGAQKTQGVDTSSELYQTLAAEYGDDPEMIQGIILSMQQQEISSITVPNEPSPDADPSQVVNL